jgi:ATP-dependent helicase/nuclease subunit B
MVRGPRVFTLPPSAPFLPALAQALVDGRLIEGFHPANDPAQLADLTLYLPTRRAARAAGDALLDALGGNALLLPRIVPLGDVDEEAFAFDAADGEPLPQAIGGAERRLALSQLVTRFAGLYPGLAHASPATRVRLADELAHLMDDFITAGIEFEQLERAVATPLDQYWEDSRKFLALVFRHWQDFLSERGAMDAAARRDALLVREAARVAADPRGFFVAAGSTGTLPKVAAFLRAISRKPNGAVVLPGFDRGLSLATLTAIADRKQPISGHPQFGLARLIETLEAAPDGIVQLAPPSRLSREALLSAAFAPQPRGADAALLGGALEDVCVIEAADAREEALAVAAILREALEMPGRSAALITPDRALARRVCAELSRWKIEVDDSAGISLSESEAGRLARLAAEAAGRDATPSTLLALLRHPWCGTRFAPADVDLLEIATLRGLRPMGGALALPGIVAAIPAMNLHRSDPRRALSDEDRGRASAVAEALINSLAPLSALEGEVRFSDAVTALGAALSRLVPAETIAPRADATALADWLGEMADGAAAAPAVSLSDLAEMLPALLSDRVVRNPIQTTAPVRILGPLEARLIDAERVVLAGLCEGIWPPDPQSGAWLNRPMRHALGLDLPERRIGLSAHDFVQACGAREVFFVRARKQNGVETIASRFLQRLGAVAPEAGWKAACTRGSEWLARLRAWERPANMPAGESPKPRPPVALRPTRFSVSDIRELARDPYAIYAGRILNLKPLDPVDEEPDNAERGTLLHGILAEFARRFPERLPPDPAARLRELGETEFARLAAFPIVRAIWWPRFLRIADWFAAWERERRSEGAEIKAEIDGELAFKLGGRHFRLTARADRIERRETAVAILDYKTGTPPSLQQALTGFEPQLLLEAAIASGGGFPGIPAGTAISEVGALKLSNGIPPGEFKPFTIDRKAAELIAKRGIGGQMEDLAADVLARAQQLLRTYESDSQPYLSAPRPFKERDYRKYDHLARRLEWIENGEADE